MNPLINPHNAADGVIGTDEQGRGVVHFERHFNHPIERVWRAITEPKEVACWLRGLEIDPRVGGSIAQFLGGVDQDGNASAATGEIIAYEPPTLIEFWTQILNHPNTEDRHIQRWELGEEGDGCVLNFSNTFAIGERARNSIVCGWHHCLERLLEALEGRPTNWETWTRDRVIELYWHYRSKPRA